MTGYEIVKAKRAHAESLAGRLRRQDQLEIWSHARLSPWDALRKSLELSSRAWCALIGGEPEAMFGVAPMLSKPWIGRPWLLSSDKVLAVHRRDFVRESRRRLEIMKADYCRLENYVLIDNLAAIRWLAWLGFKIDFGSLINTWNDRIMVKFRWDRLEGAQALAWGA